MKKIILLCLLVLPSVTFSQNTTYFMEHLPQTIHYNPALIPEVKFYMGWPGMGGIALDAYNSGFNYNELDRFTGNIGQSAYNPDKFTESIGDYNRSFAKTKINIFSLGFRLKDKVYLSFHTHLNGFLGLKASSGVVYLADLDALATDAFPVSVDHLNFTFNSYISLGFTYSRVINEHLTLGISPRLNLNQMGIKSDKLNYVVSRQGVEYGQSEYEYIYDGELFLGLPTHINPYAVNGDEFNTSEGLLPESWSSDLSVSNLFQNKSLSVDIGAVYSFREFAFSASILNIGASTWKTNGYHLNGNNESLLTINPEKIIIGIPPQAFLGGRHQFSKKWNYGLIFQNTFYKEFYDASATLSLNGDVGSMLSTSVSYTAGYKFDNVGLGLRLRFFPGMDIYMVTDNVIQLVAYKNAYRATAAIGINYAFGVREELF